MGTLFTALCPCGLHQGARLGRGMFSATVFSPGYCKACSSVVDLSSDTCPECGSKEVTQYEPTPAPNNPRAPWASNAYCPKCQQNTLKIVWIGRFD